jgi:hypothetical protein
VNCPVPSPNAGISAPVFNLKVFVTAILPKSFQEVAFVLVERPLKIRMLSESGISRKRIERRFRRWKDRKEQKWSDPRFVARIFPHPERKEDMGRIILKIVTSLDEVWQIVAEWPPRVPQV